MPNATHQTITQAEWQRYITDAGKNVPLFDLIFSMRQFAWLYLGAPRWPVSVPR